MFIFLLLLLLELGAVEAWELSDKVTLFRMLGIAGQKGTFTLFLFFREFYVMP